MILAEARVGPYLRALRSAVEALAPNRDFVPLRAAVGHLRALDPAVSGTMLGPAEVEPSSGMPSYTWLERARAEAASAMAPPDADTVRRAEALDPALGRRMRDRANLHEHYAMHPLLEVSAIAAAARKLDPPEAAIAYDRVLPDGRWLRVRSIIALDRIESPFSLDVDRLTVHPSLQHLLTRHTLTPLLALQDQLEDATGGRVVRLSRGTVGPFWFPGVPLPPDLPPELGQGLLLHLAIEVVGEDVRRDERRDPLLGDNDVARPGQHVFQERRFACNEPQLGVVTRWLEPLGIGQNVTAFGSRIRPRRL